jgi:hypothetical protein
VMTPANTGPALTDLHPPHGPPPKGRLPGRQG